MSSSVFGLDFFNSGLLSSELRELSKIKIRCTIFCENIPQIIIQVIYLQTGEGNFEVTILAMAASLLSVASTLIIYFGEKDNQEDDTVAKYFLRLFKMDSETGLAAAASKAAKDAIKSNRKKKKGLMEVLKEQVGSGGDKQIEVGTITMKDYGVIVHVQQLVTAAKLMKYKINKKDFNLTEYDYIRSLYEEKMQNVRRSVWEHFGLNSLNESGDREMISSWDLEYQIEFEVNEDDPSSSRGGALRLRSSVVSRSGDGRSSFAGGLATTNQPKQHIKHASNASEIEMQPMPRDGDYVSEYAGDPSDANAILGEISRLTARLTKLLEEKSGNQSVLQSTWDNTE